MGYTHYWEINLEKDDWNKFISEYAIPILQDHCNIICDEYNFTKHIENANEVLELESDGKCTGIRFNGVDPNDFETFLLKNDGKDGFCKTNKMPYDNVVTSLLLVLYLRFNADVDIGTDGYKDDWEYAIGYIDRKFPYLSKNYEGMFADGC